jgi:hypothetical protein
MGLEAFPLAENIYKAAGVAAVAIFGGLVAL